MITINIHHLSEKFPISNETVQIIEKVRLITGKDINFILVNDLFSYALLKAARTFMEKHIVYINESKIANINHLIIHECHHLFRFWSVDEEKRFTLQEPESSRNNRIEQWKNELRSKGISYPSAVFNMWATGIMSLFYNAVTDTRIELAIYYNYPAIRPEQLRSLKTIEDEVRQTMDKKIEKMVPESLFELTGAINYVFLSILSPIVGDGWKKPFKGKASISQLGNKLLRTIPDEDEGLIQDIMILNKWSGILQLDGIVWTPFELVPKGYETKY